MWLDTEWDPATRTITSESARELVKRLSSALFGVDDALAVHLGND
jgi:hypothetical protein